MPGSALFRSLVWLLVTCIALIFAGLAGTYLWLFVQSMLHQPTREHLTTLLFLWQTQTGAAFALAAAFIGAVAVLHQTTATARRSDARRGRRATALRAVLPLMLSELIGYTEWCAKIMGRGAPKR